MKYLLASALGVLLFSACQKQTANERVSPAGGKESTDVIAKERKIEICHKAGPNNWHTISININALPAHLAHGDIVPDADGDGYTTTNPCGNGNQDDCDDNNPAINPGAAEICNNNIDDNCNGQVDEGCTPSVTLCNQVWMLYNLDVDHYRNGDTIHQAKTAAEWFNATNGAYCYYNNDSATYAAVYGKLYNWYAVHDPRGLAPAGWHIPGEFEWNTLTRCLDPSTDTTNPASIYSFIAGGFLKETGFAHWISPNGGATNSSGFTALPAGYRDTGGGFYTQGTHSMWWSSDGNINIGFARGRYLIYTTGQIALINWPVKYGLSVRCVKD
ncbi:MAG: FISUMP domain-containing protein [Chitinophagaceae bacterium]